jgi:putative heme-binding domain-containing protein
MLVHYAATCIGLSGLLSLGGVAPALAADGEPDRTALAVEALSRMQNVDLNQNPKLKEAVYKLLDKTRGTPNFVKLVNQFKLTDQNAGLLEMAVSNPTSEAGVEAMRLILAGNDSGLLEKTLQSTNLPTALKATEALGNTGDKRATPLLMPLVTNATREVSLGKQAVRALAQTSEGAHSLLALAKAETLADELRFTASSELSRARWPEIKTEAAKLLPLPQGRDAQPLPPLAELLTKKGDAANGAKVFSSPTAGCAQCHQVHNQGGEVGPNLSEIGSKLGKDALYEAILDPSAGISFGYEAWQIQLKSGDDAFGLIASETAEELAVKDSKGIITRYKKTDVVQRQPSKLSIMPAGLQQVMSLQELVDLVEYLASLKKSEATAR